jgi:hypothetical protein
MQSVQPISKYALPLLGLYFLSGILTIIFFDGTGDVGDSIMHYLFSKYAYAHPENFLDHWAKPVFVFLSAPFAQFGFNGLKLFNLLCNGLSIWLIYLVANRSYFRYPLLIFPILMFMPDFYVLTFSGLTEPLFALFLTAGVWAAVYKKPIVAAILISFLPLVRSEGLIILGIFAFYFLIKKQWKVVFYLATGQLVYSIVGAFYYQDVLWVFHKIPYTKKGDFYGQGDWSNFVNKLFYMIGAPTFVLFILGGLHTAWRWLLTKQAKKEEIYLITGTVVCFITAHTLFWVLGIFGSMGLGRVLISIIPLVAWLALAGLEWLMSLAGNRLRWRYGLMGLVLILLIYFPFSANPAAIDWKGEMSLKTEQLLANQLIEDYKDQDPNRWVYTHPHLSLALGIDCFDKEQHLRLYKSDLEKLEKGDLLIWDDWFSRIDGQLPKELLDQQENLKLLKTYEQQEGGRLIEFRVYERR